MFRLPINNWRVRELSDLYSKYGFDLKGPKILIELAASYSVLFEVNFQVSLALLIDGVFLAKQFA